MKWPGFNFWIPLLIIVAVASSAMTLIATHPEGSLHHGIVGEELCAASGADSLVLIDFGNNSSHVYRVGYETCVNFLYHHRQGVTIQDDAWENRIASYRFDGPGVIP